MSRAVWFSYREARDFEYRKGHADVGVQEQLLDQLQMHALAEEQTVEAA
jgi:hypothetical protein